MLRLEHISVAYGKHEALHDVTLKIESGRTTVILGANGAGKTTLLNTIAGLMRPHPGGRILFEGRAIENDSPHRIVAAGIALVPEGRRLFGDMTVIENLRMGAYTPHARANEGRQLEKQLALFPLLAPKLAVLAGNLSGGEQQILETAMVLEAGPSFLLLDEPSLGLSPANQDQVFATIADLRGRGLTMLVVEQNAHGALQISDTGMVMELGRLFASGPAAGLLADPRIKLAYLGGAPVG